MYQLIYNHSGISLDDITIQLNAGLVTSITTTTTDETVPIIQGVTNLLSQVSATQAAIAKAEKLAVAPSVTPPCADMQVTYVRNITHDDGKPFLTQPGTAGCTVRFTVNQVLISRLPLGVSGFAAPDETGVPVVDVCRNDYVFCFRLGSIYRIEVSAVIVNGKSTIGAPVSLPSFTVAAPDASMLGFVRFNRRAFVANKTAVGFDGTGLLSSFAATNPSEVLGFIALPTAIAAGVAAAVAIH
jgi:hypothetical protein